MNPVSAWTATVQSDIAQASALAERVISGYVLRLYNTGDSLWITASWPGGGRMAFRAAYAFGDGFDLNSLDETSGGMSVSLATRLGEYHVRLRFPKSDSPVFRYTTTFKPFQPLLIPFCPRDIVPLTESGFVENTRGKVHTQQVGARSGHLFASFTRPRTGSIFYFQNLTALSQYCEATHSVAAETVGGQWPDMGFRFHGPEAGAFPVKEMVISDAFVLLSDMIPDDDFEITRQFLNHLAALYVLLPKPETRYHDWHEIAEKGLHDLTFHKGCWTHSGGHPYFNAYVSDYKTPAEIMVQLAVLVPLKEYLEFTGGESPIVNQIEDGLGAFYDESIQTISRWLPSMMDNLDKSEEQKREMVMDSWYLHHPLMNLARLAQMGNKDAEKLLLASVEYAIKVAHEFDYEWPVFYKMDTLEILKAEMQPGKGGEKDVPGSYAHLMLEVWKITKDKRYFTEAVKAAKKLIGLGFDIFYQANNTAFSAGAMLELYKETGDEEYLNLSYSCLASVFKNVQLWDAHYGCGRYYPRFFAMYPLSDAPYTAAYEEFEVYAALDHYLKAAVGIEILPSVRLLIAEMVRYFIFRMPYYYPPMLPRDILSDEVKTGEIDTDLWVPLEDLYDGWSLAGQVGQEVYGAGSGFGIVPRQYFKLVGEDVKVFVDYPVTAFKRSKTSAVLTIDGDPSMRCKVVLFSDGNRALNLFQLKIASGEQLDAHELQPNHFAYDVPGGTRLTISWK
ncbi:MAG TPA: hypothetical protein VF676_12765 [Flavobacterium sp.]|jgi:hypothetical protein